ncbi:MAG: hypothetical protein MI756_08330 [Chromatiales bacterium]|nr:hypothetical protein [Chromatiales bacterium]
MNCYKSHYPTLISLLFFVTLNSSAAIIEYRGSANVTNAHDGSVHYVTLSMSIDEELVIHGRPLPPIEDRISDEHPAHFNIPNYQIDIEKVGTFSGENGYFAIWYDEDPYTRNVHPEHLDILAGHGYLTFRNSDGTQFGLSSWRGDDPTFDLPPVMILEYLNVFQFHPVEDGEQFDLIENGFRIANADLKLTPVPIPAAAWLFSVGLLGLFKIAKRHKLS